MPLYPPFIADQYAVEINAAIQPFAGRPLTSETLAYLKQVVRDAQTKFFYKYPEYCASSDIIIDQVGNDISVAAPICMRHEKLEIEANQHELMRQLERNIISDIRRDANFQRKHRKLMRRYQARLPEEVRVIWESLSKSQQYAVLKTIDYNVRHNAERGAQ